MVTPSSSARFPASRRADRSAESWASMLCRASRAPTRWPAWQTTTPAPMTLANRRLASRTSRWRPGEVRSMRLTSSGAWTVYARSAPSSNSLTARSLLVSRWPPRMTPRFCGQTSTKSGPASSRVLRSSASPLTPSTYIRARLVPTLRKTMQFLSPSGPHRTARSIGPPKSARVKGGLRGGKTWVNRAGPCTVKGDEPRGDRVEQLRGLHTQIRQLRQDQGAGGDGDPRRVLRPRARAPRPDGGSGRRVWDGQLLRRAAPLRRPDRGGRPQPRHARGRRQQAGVGGGPRRFPLLQDRRAALRGRYVGRGHDQPGPAPPARRPRRWLPRPPQRLPGVRQGPEAGRGPHGQHLLPGATAPRLLALPPDPGGRRRPPQPLRPPRRAARDPRRLRPRPPRYLRAHRRHGPGRRLLRPPRTSEQGVARRGLRLVARRRRPPEPVPLPHPCAGRAGRAGGLRGP